MNENQNNVNMSQGDIEAANLKNFFKKKKEEEAQGTKLSKEEKLAKYFTPRNPQEKFRILPRKDNEKYDIAFFHVLRLRINGPTAEKGGMAWKKVYCPAHNDPRKPKLDENGNKVLDQNGKPVLITSPCPICDKYNKEIAKQDQSIKYIKKENLNEEQKVIKAKNDEIFKEATKWQAKKFYIYKGLDMNKKSDGPKFWRFKHSFKKDGYQEKLWPMAEYFLNKYNKAYYSVTEGCDFILTVVDSVQPNGNKFKNVTGIMPEPPSKIHDDELMVQQWVNDTTTWRDVFKPTKAPGISAYEYLEFALKGQEPYFDDSDSTHKRWVFPGHPELEEKANNRDHTFNTNAAEMEYATGSYDEDDEYSDTTPSNVTKNDVGSFKDNAVDITLELKNHEFTKEENEEFENLGKDVKKSSYSELDDLPF